MVTRASNPEKHFQISCDLAVAIGWRRDANFRPHKNNLFFAVRAPNAPWTVKYKLFDYRDPRVIRPIQARYRVDIRRASLGMVSTGAMAISVDGVQGQYRRGETEEMAIAFAVIDYLKVPHGNQT